RWRDVVGAFEARGAGGVRAAQAPLFVEIVRAYGEIGALEPAARLVALLEQLPGAADQPALTYLVARARLHFLAYARRAAAVERLRAARGPLARMRPDARGYWTGVARAYGGDRDGARAALEGAAARSGDRALRSATEERLATLPVTPARALDPELDVFAD